jgi:hypothetical protein
MGQDMEMGGQQAVNVVGQRALPLS